MAAIPCGLRGEVFVATSVAEAQRLQEEITFEMPVVDPWFWAV